MNEGVLPASMAPWREALAQAIVTLCAIPSVRGVPEPGAPFGRETRRALDAFLDLGAALGLKPVCLDGYCGYLEWGDSGPITAVLGHLDVVPAIDGWTHDPFVPVVTAERIIARGAADDKGPLVAALYALQALRVEGFQPRGRIRLIAGLDEESGSACMRHYVEVAELPAAGFTPDASFPVIYAEKGIAHLRLTMKDSLQNPFPVSPAGVPVLVGATAGQRANMVPARCELTWQDPDASLRAEVFTGRAAHASPPWEGQNAISRAMAAAYQEAAGRHPFLNFYQTFLADDWQGQKLGIAGQDDSGPLTLNVGILHLDREAASITLDIRYPASWSLPPLLAAIRSQVEPLGIRVEVQSDTPPLSGDPDRPLVRSLMAVYNRMTGRNETAIAIGGGTYARSMPNIVAFGPTFPGEPDLCHQADEAIVTDKLLAAAAIYREALRVLAG